jgi:hypothetical protein
VVRLHIVKAGFLIGVGSGSGVLTYGGKSYGLAVSGVVADIPAQSLDHPALSATAS